MSMRQHNRVSVDPPVVDRSAAVSLVIHHLGLAAALYEAMPDGPAGPRLIQSEIARLTREEVLDEDQGNAMSAFVEVLRVSFEAMGEDEE